MLPACSASAPAGILSRPKPRPPLASRPVPGRSEPAACSASAPAGILSRPRPPPASRPVPGRSEPAACPVIWSPAFCPNPGLGPRRYLVPVPASAPAGISSRPKPRPPPVSCPNPGLGPRRSPAPARHLRQEKFHCFVDKHQPCYVLL